MQITAMPNLGERSSKWYKVKSKFMTGKSCEICSGLQDLTAHHIKPFHLFPNLELRPSNLIALCKNCHFFIAHNSDWRLYNPNIKKTAYYVKVLLKNK